MDRRANSSRAGNDPRSSLFFFFFCSLAILFRVYFRSFFFQTVLFYFFLFSSRVFFSHYSLGNNSARCNRCSLSKEKLVEWGGEFFFNRISLLLPFRCLEISLFFLSSFFSKEFKFTIKYLRISMYNRRRCVAYRIKILHDL